MSDRYSTVPSGETERPEQDPSFAGEQDPAVRDPRPDGPMDQEGDSGAEEFGEGPRPDEQVSGGRVPSEDASPT